MRTLKRLLLRQQSFFTHCNRVEGNIKGVHGHAWSWGYILPLLGRIRAFHPLVTCAARRTKKDLAPSSCEERDKILDITQCHPEPIHCPFVVVSHHPATLYRLPEHLLLIFLSISNLPIFFHVNIVLRNLLGDIPYRRANTFEKYNSSL